MTDKSKTSEKKNSRPSHLVFAKSEDFNPPVNIKLAAIWPHQNGNGLNFALEDLFLELRKEDDGSLHPALTVNTKIYGQECKIKVGSFTPLEENTFQLNLGDLVAFENKPKDTNTSKSQPTKNQPKP